MRRSRRNIPPPLGLSASELLCRRAWRCNHRGEQRRAMLALREAAHADEGDARLWALYGVQCIRIGRVDAARQALSHAVWLRERSHEHAKALVTRRLLESISA